MNSVLCNQGYIINKNDLTDKQMKEIKSDLKVKPFIRGKRGQFAKRFKIYMENDKKLSIPKFYGINKLGVPKKTDLLQGKDIV